MMVACEFCKLSEPDGKCRLGLKIPAAMSCREFEPGIERFCSNPQDFASPRQIIEMATHFGIKGVEQRRSS